VNYTTITNESLRLTNLVKLDVSLNQRITDEGVSGLMNLTSLVTNQNIKRSVLMNLKNLKRLDSKEMDCFVVKERSQSNPTLGEFIRVVEKCLSGSGGYIYGERGFVVSDEITIPLVK